MAGSEDDIPPPPPPSQTPTQQTPHTVSTIKLPILKKGEYDIWAMKMEHYLAHTDYPIWEVIQRGNGPVSVSTDTNGLIKVLPPKTAEEILARERERKARTTLLMALPEDHLAKFHKMTDAKEMWEAIKSRFGGNDESKKMQKYILKQQFEGFSVSNSEGLHKGYDRFQSLLSQLEIHGAGVSTEDANQKFLRSLPSAWSQVSLIMRTKPGVDSLSFDDLYNNLRVFESDVKGSTASSSSTQNVAFVSENTSSTNDLYPMYHEDLEQLDEFDLEEMDLKWQEDSKALVTLDGEGVDWTSHSEDEQENYALMACSSSGSDTEVTSCSKECKESYAKLKKLYDEQREQLGDASIEIQAYTQALKKVEAQLVAHQQSQLWYEEKIRFMKIDLDDKTDVLTYHKKLLAEAEKEKEDLKAKVEKWHNSSKNLNILLNSQMSAKDKAGLGYGDQMNKSVLSYENEVFQSVFVSRTSDIEDSHVNDRYAEGMHAVPPPMTGIYIPSGPDKEIDDSQFTYGPKQSKPSESDARSSDFNSCESNCSKETHESMSEPVVNEPKVVSEPKVWSDALIIKEYESDSEDEHIRPVWNNVQRMNHQNQFVPKAVLTRTGKIPFNTARTSSTNTVNTARHNFNRQAIPINAARKVNIVKPIMNNARPKVGFHKSISPFKKSFNKTTALGTNFSKQKVNIAEVNAVSAVKGKRETADYLQRTLQNKGIVDSGCSRHMTGNNAYLAEYQDFNGGPVAFGGSKGYIIGKGKIKTGKLDFEDVCFVKELQHFNLFSVSPVQTEIPAIEEIYNNPTDGIFTNASYDDEGTVADFTNLETIVNVSPIPTSRINSIHPSTLILGDPKSAVQTRSKVTKSSRAYAFVSYIQKQRRNNHKDFQHCLFTCFLSQNEPKKISEALEDESWVDAMQEELQDKYVAEILKKFDFISVKTASTPIETQKPLVKDEEASEVDVHLYRSMIGSLIYLTTSRPDIMFAVCACSRFQVTPKTSHLNVVKRIFRYLKGKPKLGLWYPRVSSFDLEAYSDSNYAGANLDKKYITRGCQFLGRRLISWQCKKQTIVATSTIEAEYVATANCCEQVLWIQNQMLDYGFNFMNTKIYIDNESTICIVKNPVFHSKTK
ncbi:hypothetical protein Tco_1546896 [Tanacetum coccineum]